MEFASVMAGETFSDNPSCTHPLLAAVGRFVNDNVDDDTRRQLLPLVPAVVGVRRGGPAVTAAIVTAITFEALAVDPDSRQLRRACRRATRRGRTVTAGMWPTIATDPIYRRGAGRRAVMRALCSIGPTRPAALHEALFTVIAAARDAHQAAQASSARAAAARNRRGGYQMGTSR